MVPFNSNNNKENCSPISSNCVIWQGPDLLCLNLCKGDSVSDVVYKAAQEICQIKEAIKLTDVDFNCLLDACTDLIIPTDKKLENVIQLLTNAICCVAGVVYNTSSSLALVIDREYGEPTLQLPECLWYIDPATGLPVTTLILNEYVVLVANKLCDLTITIGTLSTQVSNLNDRVTFLENEPSYEPPQVTPLCVYPTLTPGVPVEMDALLSNIDLKLCNLENILGGESQLLSIPNYQCEFLNNQDALSQAGIMATIPGWNTNVSSVAQSLENLWLTVCDIRSAVYDLKGCCSTDCSQFILFYTASRNEAGTSVTLIFNSGTVIPASFVNCPLLSTVTVTDGNGHIYTNTLDLVSVATNPIGITYDISASTLNPNLPYVVTVNGCLQKDGNSCTKEKVVVINPVTTTTTSSTTTTSTTSTSTTTSSTTTTSTTTTTTCGPCYYWTASPTATDLADATGNSNAIFNNAILVDIVDCDGVLSQVGYTNTTIDQPLGCSCNVPFAYYYKNDVQTPCDPGTLNLDSICTP